MKFVSLERDGDVATVVLARPEARNALSIAMCDEIASLFESLPSDVRVVLLRGDGSVFCSGADLGDVSGERALEFVERFEHMLDVVARQPRPTVAEIHGAALGGGLQLATVCDFRLASADAKLGIPAARLGILVNFENIRRLVLLVGIARAKEILMAAPTFTGEEAYRWGLVTSSHPAERLADEAAAFARRLAGLAPLSLSGTKAAIQAFVDEWGDVRRSRPEAAAALDELVAHAYSSADLAEGLRAAAQRREPRFSGS